MRIPLAASVVVGVLLAASNSLDAQTTFLTSPADFSGTEAIIDFEGLSSLVDTVDGVLLRLAPSGVPPRLLLDPSVRKFGPPGESAIDPSVGTFPPGGWDDLLITFPGPVNRIGFEVRTFVGDNLDVSIHCVSEGVVVGSFTFPTPGTTDYEFYAFESAATFDQILVDAQFNINGYWRMDNLRYEFKEPIALLQGVQALGFPGNSGEAKVGSVLDALGQSPPDIQGAIDALNDFINLVNAQSGKKIPFAIADQLIDDAQAIIDLLTG